MKAHQLEGAIRAKLAEVMTPRLQRDLGRIASQLREQGATDESIREQLSAFVEMNRDSLLDAARKVSGEIIESGFLNE